MSNHNLEEKFNFGVVSERNLYRSGQPDEEFLRYLKKTYKIKTIVALRMDIPEFEEKFCKENDINFVRLPIKSWRRWPEPDEVSDFFKLFQFYWNLPVLVHCLKGKDRTSALVALYRIGCDQWRLKDAVAEMKRWKANWFWRLFIQTRANKVVEGFREKRLVLLYLMRFLNLIFGFDGLIFTIKNEKNIQMFLAVQAILLGIAVWQQVTLLEFCVILLAFVAFIAFEMGNTAIERLADIAHPQFDYKVKIVKDVPSGRMILLGTIGFAIWALLVFF